jgi:putative tryptophan/tyrosine transport system substrate-binding protein
VVAKRLELLRELIPQAVRVAVLSNPNNPQTEATLRELEAVARATGRQILVSSVTTSVEIDLAFATFARARPDALFVAGDPFLLSRRVQLALLAAIHRIPATFQLRDYVEVGGLMSYGASLIDAYRQVGLYAGHILHGSKPADLPVVQASKLELVINHQTARSLGLTVPTSLLALADEVIE